MNKKCPKCQSTFDDNDFMVSKPKLKKNPKWYESSHIRGEIKCPQCGTNLIIKLVSLWWLFLLVPASAAFFTLPSSIGPWVFVMSGLAVLIIVKYSIKYEYVDL